MMYSHQVDVVTKLKILVHIEIRSSKIMEVGVVRFRSLVPEEVRPSIRVGLYPSASYKD